MSGRRLRNGLIVALCVFLGSGAALAKGDRLPPSEKGGNDLYQQDWFLETFLNLPDDLEEAAANGKRLVIFTPTLQFFPESLEKVAGRNGKVAEVLRIPGYFKLFHFYFLFHYAYERAYETEPNFQRYLSVKGDELRARGVDMDAQLWADTLLFD